MKPPEALRVYQSGGSPPTPSTADFEWTVDRDIEALDGSNDAPAGIWSDRETLWVVDEGGAVHAYDLATGERIRERGFAPDAQNADPRGIWSDRERVWLSDAEVAKLFAYELAGGDRRPDADIDLDPGNADPRGIWSDGENMWVLDGGRGSLFAYDLARGALLGEHALNPGNRDPRGIWSDGVGVWVSDPGPGRLFAYRLPDPIGGRRELERVPGEEFGALEGAGNGDPWGIWSDRDVMYVADQDKARVFTYNMPDAIDTRLVELTLEGFDIGPFAPGRSDYVGTAALALTRTTVSAAPIQPQARVAISPPDADPANGHQVDLVGVTAVTVKVTSPDGARTRVYRVLLHAPGKTLALVRAWNYVVWPGDDGTPIAQVLEEGGLSEQILAIHRWDPGTETWLVFRPDHPELITLSTFDSGEWYWIAATEAVIWTVPGGEFK